MDKGDERRANDLMSLSKSKQDIIEIKKRVWNDMTNWKFAGPEPSPGLLAKESYNHA